MKTKWILIYTASIFILFLLSFPFVPKYATKWFIHTFNNASVVSGPNDTFYWSLAVSLSLAILLITPVIVSHIFKNKFLVNILLTIIVSSLLVLLAKFIVYLLFPYSFNGHVQYVIFAYPLYTQLAMAVSVLTFGIVFLISYIKKVDA